MQQSPMPQSFEATRFSARVVAASDCDPIDIAAWAALEARAAEPNAYLSPYFVLPAARHLTPDRAPLVLFVERTTAHSRELVGVGIFNEAESAGLFPARKLVAYQSQHSFLGGLLLDRDCTAPALQTMLRFVGETMPHCQGIELPHVWADGPLSDLRSTAPQSFTFAPRARGAVARSILVPGECLAQLGGRALKSRVRDLNRRMRRLQERGTVGWRWHRDEGVPDEAVEAFLALEHMDWKGEEGSSLRSSPRGEAFFREVVAGFASARRALFTELTLDGAAIASTCNLISGNVGFGFKIGWNPDFRAMSPGWLNEIEFMRHAPTHFGDIAYFDSGASPSSFINDLWLTRRTLTTLSVPTRVLGACTLLVRDMAGRLKRSLSGPGSSPGVDATNPAATDGNTDRRWLAPARSLAA